jgi:hypothetical protein
VRKKGGQWPPSILSRLDVVLAKFLPKLLPELLPSDVAAASAPEHAEGIALALQPGNGCGGAAAAAATHQGWRSSLHSLFGIQSITHVTTPVARAQVTK